MNTLRSLVLLAIPMVVVACATHAPESPSPGGDAPQSLPAAFIVSTNEPFWQARVEGAVVRLTGPDQQRTLQVLSNEAVFDGRVVTARDSLGTLEMRVTERLCMDSMSGASFAYTARLTFDKEPPVEGCGKPIAAK